MQDEVAWVAELGVLMLAVVLAVLVGEWVPSLTKRCGRTAGGSLLVANQARND